MERFKKKKDRMKRFLLAPLILVLSSCGYGSFYQAEEACWKWVSKGGSYQYEDLKLSNRTTVRTSNIRHCEIEERTKQLLGFKDTNKRNGSFYKLGTRPDRKIKLVKKFQY